MNALVTMEAILEPAAGVVLSAESIFGTGQAETIVSAIESQVRAEVFDITTEDGRERVKSVAYKIARSKTTLDEIGKEHVAEIKKQAGAVDAERRTIRDRLDALKDEVRGPLTAWESAEADRIALHESALVFLIESTRFAATVPSVNCIEQRIESVRAACRRDWQEFHERAEAAATDALATLETMLATAKQAEADAAELAELRKLKAEREEADRKAEAERVAAQQAAERKAYEERRERERAEKAEKDKAAAVAAAIEQERRRQEQEAAASAAKKAAEEAAELKRQQNVAHRKKVLKKIIAALILKGVPDTTACLLAVDIDEGKIPHLSINY